MKRCKYFPAFLLGVSGALGFDCMIMYVCSYPAKRHPISLPVSLCGGVAAACLCIVLFCVVLMHIITAKGARIRTALLSLLFCAGGFAAFVPLWGYAYSLCKSLFQRFL